jgi:16S rRNA (guanine1207-N2)-methyltransferase
MTDLAIDWITQQLTSLHPTNENKYVWCTDENALNSLPSALHQQQLLVITNRWDVAQQAQNNGFQCDFSDFDCSGIADNSLDGIFYRVSKEKPVVHHLLNQAWRCLKPGGQLQLAGYKNEGTKTYIEKIAKVMGDAKNIEKHGHVYASTITKRIEYNANQQLDDSDYTNHRPISPDSGLTLVSKPGLFGWNKIDQGSALLIDYIRQHPQALNTPHSCLDLGCGYGYLTIAAAGLDACKSIHHWTMTDNNAAALNLAPLNLHNNQLQGEVIAADAGKDIVGKVDLLLCNPPFHQGFDVNGDLTDKFLRSAKQRLAPEGMAIFVVNQFIPLERKAAPLFNQINILLDNGSFKLIQLKH